MEKGNCSCVSEFILLGLSDRLELSIFHFLVFFLNYGVTIMGNLGVITVFQASFQFHNPVYFCLSYLSLVDFCYFTIIVPKMLANIMSKDTAISFLRYMVHFYLFYTYMITEVILLAVMAYNHYVTICNPLLYMDIIFWKLYLKCLSACYLCGTVCFLIPMCLALKILSYRSNVLNLFCSLPSLLSFACSDVSVNELVVYIMTTFNEVITIVIIFTSYLFILIIILRMYSAEGIFKFLPTCASHFTAIVIFHETIIYIYCKPSSDYSLETESNHSVLYCSDSHAEPPNL
ncbi:olfactory receptor 5L1-like [Tamandua tetradactyla]|uniref:olfactory receptor 5L1-like n=1 Tax=Tamandua tetradactyla TaxID=48850 RepID=UPI00405489D9